MKEKYTEMDGVHYALIFVLEEARNEPPLRRASILLSANRFTNEERISDELTELAESYIDLTQAFHGYLIKVRENHREEANRVSSLSFFMEKAENVPLKLLAELLNGQAGLIYASPHERAMEEMNEYMKCYDDIRAWEYRHDTFILKLRTRQYDMSNAEAAALESETKPLRAV